MLPFLTKKTQTGVTVKQRASDEKPETEKESGDEGIEACAQDLINAVHARDVKKVAAALKAAFEIADSEPHEEGDHVEPHSYDAQNQKAAQEQE